MTEAQTKYPESQRENLVAQLSLTLQRKMDEEDCTFDKAFNEVALETLGYDVESLRMSDGPKDHGVDFWVVEEQASTVFQFKSHDFTERLDANFVADPKYLTDLPRIRSLLENSEETPKEANAKVVEFVKELRSSAHRYGLTSESKENAYEITIYFCCLAKDLTAQAKAEFQRLSAPIFLTIGGQKARVTTAAVLLDDLIAERWRESNTDWRTSSGKSGDEVEFAVCGEMIASPKSVTFFTKAQDLVSAFDTYGYQMFEPNVRCELKRSKVNEAIRESIKHRRGRKEFKHLNNGITMICASFRKVKRGEELVIKIRQPGVINGLQTVKSIHDAAGELNTEEKEHFAKECEVLVRLHTRAAVSDYKELVKSTNNQNPMQPRNLRSNEPEQIYYEALFADISWFYERKEGAWKAFQSDSALWGSLRGKKVGDFKGKQGVQAKCIDNLEMAQAWLSFIGFSNEAIHNKRDIFSDDKFYDLVFKKRTTKHGFDYNLSFSDPAVREESEDQAPSPSALLLSELLREIADGLTPSRKQNREACVKRLRLERSKKEDQDAKLVQDSTYIRGLVLAGAKYLFVDFCGLILLRALGAKVHDAAVRILSTPSMKPIFDDRDLKPFRAVIDGGNFVPRDVIAALWALYNDCLENIIEQPAWRQQFEQAAVRSRFNYSDYNRKALFAQLESLDQVYQRRPLPKPWSEGMEKAKGIYSYVKSEFR